MWSGKSNYTAVYHDSQMDWCVLVIFSFGVIFNRVLYLLFLKGNPPSHSCGNIFVLLSTYGTKDRSSEAIKFRGRNEFADERKRSEEWLTAKLITCSNPVENSTDLLDPISRDTKKRVRQEHICSFAIKLTDRTK